MAAAKAESGKADLALIDGLAAILHQFTVRDLSHVLREGIPFFPTHTRYYHLDANKSDDPAVMFQILMHEHNGTHVDAPAQYFREGPDPSRHYMHSVAPTALMGPACVLDLSDNPETLIPVDRVVAWEERHGPIREGDIVIFNFGWHRKWGLHEAGMAYVEDWPGLHRTSAQYLLERRIKAVGTDCLSIDCCGSTEIPAHDRFLRNDILIMENLANLDDLPQRFFFVAAPLKIHEGSGSPIRAVALLPRDDT